MEPPDKKKWYEGGSVLIRGWKTNADNPSSWLKLRDPNFYKAAYVAASLSQAFKAKQQAEVSRSVEASSLGAITGTLMMPVKDQENPGRVDGSMDDGVNDDGVNDDGDDGIEIIFVSLKSGDHASAGNGDGRNAMGASASSTSEMQDIESQTNECGKLGRSFGTSATMPVKDQENADKVDDSMDDGVNDDGDLGIDANFVSLKSGDQVSAANVQESFDMTGSSSSSVETQDAESLELRSTKKTDISRGDRGTRSSSRIHDAKRTHICQHCDKKFGLSQSLHDHVRSAHKGLRCSCNTCRIKSRTNSSKSRHYVKVQKESDTANQKKKSTCQMCGKQFAFASAKAVHIQSIHKGKRWSCQYCSKEYMYPAATYIHKKTCAANPAVLPAALKNVVKKGKSGHRGR